MKNKKEIIYDEDKAYKSLENINSWINNSDTKVSIILGLLGVIFTVVFSNTEFCDLMLKLLKSVVKDIRFGELIYLLLIFLSIVLIIYGIYKLFRVLVPRLEFNLSKGKKSILYFGEISNYDSFNDFKRNVYKISKKELYDDILHQIYINANICNVKFKNYNYGLKSSIIGIILFTFLYILGVVIYI